MKDAFGGIANIFLVTIFLVIVSGILGFIFSYAKAFRMKNIVISTLERYQGSVSCFQGNSTCANLIKSQAERIAYAPANISCVNIGNVKYKPYEIDGKTLFCYALKKDGKYSVYSITTQVDINLPIMDKILGWSIFRVNGETRVLK